jgi:hypothetical protein
MSEDEERPGGSREGIQVWRRRDGGWRWRYVHVDGDGERLELPASEDAATEDDAVAAARLAYPGLPLERLTGEDRPAEDAVDPTPALPEHPLLWGAASGTVTLLLAAVAIRWRRWWLLPAAPLLAVGIVRNLRRRLP